MSKVLSVLIIVISFLVNPLIGIVALFLFIYYSKQKKRRAQRAYERMRYMESAADDIRRQTQEEYQRRVMEYENELQQQLFQQQINQYQFDEHMRLFQEEMNRQMLQQVEEQNRIIQQQVEEQNRMFQQQMQMHQDMMNNGMW